jgi:hypothetical protein
MLLTSPQSKEYGLIVRIAVSRLPWDSRTPGSLFLVSRGSCPYGTAPAVADPALNQSYASSLELLKLGSRQAAYTVSRGPRNPPHPAISNSCGDKSCPAGIRGLKSKKGLLILVFEVN